MIKCKFVMSRVRYLTESMTISDAASSWVKVVTRCRTHLMHISCRLARGECRIGHIRHDAVTVMDVRNRAGPGAQAFQKRQHCDGCHRNPDTSPMSVHLVKDVSVE